MELHWIKLLSDAMFIAAMITLAWRRHQERGFDTTPCLSLSQRPPWPVR